MKVARFVLKIVALSLTAAAAVCAIIAYWDKLSELGDCAKAKDPAACLRFRVRRLRGVRKTAVEFIHGCFFAHFLF